MGDYKPSLDEAKMPEMETKQTLLQSAVFKQARHNEQMDSDIAMTKRLIERNLAGRLGLGSPRSHLRGVGSNGIFKAMQQHGHKSIHWLEDNLDRTLKRHDKTGAEALELRAEIDRLRKSHMLRHGRWKTGKADLVEVKAAIADAMARANEIMGLKDDIDEEIEEIKETEAIEQQEFEAECQVLSKFINERLELLSYLAEKREDKPAGAMTQEEEARVQTQMAKLTATMREASVKESEAQKEMALYQAAFDKLRRLTGITDIQHLVDSFIDVEDRNFALFRYIQNVNRETKTVRTQYESLAKEMHELKTAQGSEGMTKKQTLVALEERVKRLKAEAIAAKQRSVQLDRGLKMASARVGQLFDAIGCRDMATAAVSDIGSEGERPTTAGDGLAGGEYEDGSDSDGRPVTPISVRGASSGRGGNKQLDAVIARDRRAGSHARGRSPSRAGSVAGGSVAHSVHTRLAEMENLTKQGVSEANVLKFMGIIEQRTMEVMQRFRKMRGIAASTDGRELAMFDGPAIPREDRTFHIVLPEGEEDPSGGTLTSFTSPPSEGGSADGSDFDSAFGDTMRSAGGRRSPALRDRGRRTPAARDGAGGRRRSRSGSNARRASVADAAGKSDDVKPVNLSTLGTEIATTFEEKGLDVNMFVKPGRGRKKVPDGKKGRRARRRPGGGLGASASAAVVPTAGIPGGRRPQTTVVGERARARPPMGGSGSLRPKTEAGARRSNSAAPLPSV